MKKQEKKSIIPIVLCMIVLIVAVISLPNLNRIFWKSNEVETETEQKKEDNIPQKYQCSYGPAIDSFYNYIKSEYVIFTFNKTGEVSSINSEIKYQATSMNDYNQMLQVLNLPNENVTYDENNLVITVKNESSTSDIFPSEYKELKKYLSSNMYTCVEE